MSEQPLTHMAEPAWRAPVIRRPWVLWFMFFFQFAAIGAYFVYLNVWLHQAGLSGTEIGTINMTTALVGLVSVSLWGYLSDLTGKNRLLIAAGAAGALLAAQFIPLAHTFAGFLVLGCIGSAMGNGPGTLIDSSTLALLGDRREDYGRYRLGGSFGYILTSLSAGFIYGPGFRSCSRSTAP
jgi:PPP family 3-phenylpropionic acid transporter